MCVYISRIVWASLSVISLFLSVSWQKQIRFACRLLCSVCTFSVGRSICFFYMCLYAYVWVCVRFIGAIMYRARIQRCQFNTREPIHSLWLCIFTFIVFHCTFHECSLLLKMCGVRTSDSFVRLLTHTIRSFSRCIFHIGGVDVRSLLLVFVECRRVCVCVSVCLFVQRQLKSQRVSKQAGKQTLRLRTRTWIAQHKCWIIFLDFEHVFNQIDKKVNWISEIKK